MSSKERYVNLKVYDDEGGAKANYFISCKGDLKIEIECECCKGTGLIPQKEGAAVICTKCDGTGMVLGTVFEGRKEVDGIKRVFIPVKGVVHYGCDEIHRERVIHNLQYGCSYEEWKDGTKPKEHEEISCPYMVYEQEVMQHLCSEGTMGHTTSPQKCIFWRFKQECWKRFKEQE